MDFSSPIGVFDSGAGGITTLNACRRLMPTENFIYYGDRAYAPYGSLSAAAIIRRADLVTGFLFDCGAKCVVVACNTATNAAAAALREKYKPTVVGTEPAVLPAARENKGKRILVLTTPATAREEKFKRLVSGVTDAFGARVSVAAPRSWAADIEGELFNLDALRGKIFNFLRPYKGCGAVVLGCTHYVLIKGLIDEFFGGAAGLYDGNAGVAVRVKSALSDAGLAAKAGGAGAVSAYSSLPGYESVLAKLINSRGAGGKP